MIVNRLIACEMTTYVRDLQSIQDSLLAAPIILDLAILAELSSRISVKAEDGEYEQFHPVLSMLSFLLKAPVVPKGAPVVNALFRQRACIENILRYTDIHTCLKDGGGVLVGV